MSHYTANAIDSGLSIVGSTSSMGIVRNSLYTVAAPASKINLQPKRRLSHYFSRPKIT